MAGAPIDLLASESRLLAHSPRFLARFQSWRAGRGLSLASATPTLSCASCTGRGLRPKRILCSARYWRGQRRSRSVLALCLRRFAPAS
jgi:hypothetical protein